MKNSIPNRFSDDEKTYPGNFYLQKGFLQNQEKLSFNISTTQRTVILKSL